MKPIRKFLITLNTGLMNIIHSFFLLVKRPFTVVTDVKVACGMEAFNIATHIATGEKNVMRIPHHDSSRYGNTSYKKSHSPGGLANFAFLQVQEPFTLTFQYN